MSKRWVLWGLAGCLMALPATAGVLDGGLAAILETRDADATVSVLVFLKAQVDVDGLVGALDAERATMQRRHEVIVRSLLATAERTQGPLLDYLNGLVEEGRLEYVEAFWIANVIRVDGPKAEIEQLLKHPDVGTIYYNYEVELIEPVATAPDSGGLDAPEPGVVAVRAPEAWALGYTGQGVLVANMDTGVAGNHPALASRWAGVADPRYAGHPEWAWYDPYNNQNNFPYDTNGHGTHTMGTVCGGAPGDQIGVAPGALWIASAPIDRGGGIPTTVANAIKSFQWMLDPDQNPGTNWDVPAVCSNSWGLTTSHGYPPCDQTFWSYLDACEAAGTLIIFSAGNEGTSGLRRPADRATDAYRTLAVAAVDANTAGWPIASFSSRGPTNCTPGGTPAIKPDISAPGVQVRSATPSGGYVKMDGTSMASPHINGVVALIRQACPDLTIPEIKQIIYDTAHDLGPVGEDNSYGWGMVDAYEACLMAVSMCGPHPPRVQDGVFNTPLNTPILLTLEARDDGLPDPPGRMIFIITSLPTKGRLVDPNAGPITTVPYTLANWGNKVTYAPNFYASGPDSFTWKANDGGVPPEGGDSAIATMRGTVGGPEPVHRFNLDQDPGWAREAQWAFGKPTGGGGAYGGPDPTSGFTGNNVFGYNLNGDYTNSMPEYHLTTGALNCTRMTQVSLRFKRWLGVEASRYDHAYVRVSTNGTTWNTAWQNPDQETADASWQSQTIDISAYADNQPTVYLRWTMGTTDTSWTYCGWNLDDIEVWGLVEYTEGLIRPDSFTLFRGEVVSGGLPELLHSDDQRLVARAGMVLTPTEAPVWMIVNTTAPIANPSGLKFVLESGLQTAGAVLQTIELYNYVTQSYELVDSRQASLTETAVQVVLTGDPSRFIDPATLAMKAQIKWQANGPVTGHLWRVGIDQIVWTVPLQEAAD
ncbi:MAG: S8 family serine peptidase [Planctomycetota bacterium]